MRLFVLSLGLLAGCGGAEPPAARDLVVELDTAGPHAVGFSSVEVKYGAPITGEERKIQVLAWYPAQKVEGERPVYLLRASEVAITGAPPLDLGPLPAVVFSHGSQAYGSVMSFFSEHLASHGFLVIAPTHTGNTFANGEVRTTEIYYLRPLDVRKALDHFRGTGQAGEKALIMGHSFGGYTSFAVGGAEYAVDSLSASCAAGTGPSPFCSTFDSQKAEIFRAGLKDSRFSGIFAIDSGDEDLFGPEGVAKIRVPILNMIAEQSEDHYTAALAAVSAPKTRVLLEGGAHNDFVDSCASGVTIRCSDLPPERVWPIVRVYGLAFARSVLLSDRTFDPVLKGETKVSDLVEVSHTEGQGN